MGHATEAAVCFSCQDEHLHGIAHLPQQPLQRGVIVVVGGPQYRVGSHRQFVLLARDLAQGGIPVLRFDYRGMGDSSGEPHNFEDISSDIRSAIDMLFQLVPAMREVVLWGLCDGASASALYACQDSRVAGLVMLNPWVRTEEGLAKTYFRHYYLQRLLSPGLWKKMIKGEFSLRASVLSLWTNVTTALGVTSATNPSADLFDKASLPDRMLTALNKFKGAVLIILSTDDLTANEFVSLIGKVSAWRKLCASPCYSQRELKGANHTYSKREWRDQVAAWTGDFVRDFKGQ